MLGGIYPQLLHDTLLPLVHQSQESAAVASAYKQTPAQARRQVPKESTPFGFPFHWPPDCCCCC